MSVILVLGGVESRGSETQGHLQLHSEFKASLEHLRSSFKKTNKKLRKPVRTMHISGPTTPTYEEEEMDSKRLLNKHLKN